MAALVPRVDGLCYGGDYNPEQWPEAVWVEDAALMREAGVTLITVGVFSWAWLEPQPGGYEFGWLDRVLELLHGAGIKVDLATATASPPPWFSVAYPRSLPVDDQGRVLRHGSRQAFCPSSPEYREAALSLVERLADRYAGHPALALWHVHNEYGCHNARCHCDVSAEAFREWLRHRYAKLDLLNEAWGTAFWSQRYTDWAQILTPVPTPSMSNPSQVLDYRRFSSDALLSLFTAERDLLHRLSPGVPVTTNLMAGMDINLDHWRWAAEMTGPDRIISTDHYVIAESQTPAAAQIAYAADLTRSFAGGPWLLMEHSTSAVNWQPRNLAKPRGRLVRDALGHVARGSDGAMFFQWRASSAGAEKWHSAMVPHAGTDTQVWRDVVELGGQLSRLGEIAGSTVDSRIAIVVDYASGWAQEGAGQPSRDMPCFDELRRWHGILWRQGHAVDFAHPEADLDPYALVLVPSLYLVTDASMSNLDRYVRRGGTVLVGPYSGVVDENDHVRLGGYPGGLRDLLGVRMEEYHPLPEGGSVTLTDGSTGVVWSERGRVTDAEVVAAYAEGATSVAGDPAITRAARGGGTAWYTSTRLDDAALGALLTRLAGALDIGPTVPGIEGNIEAIRRRRPDGTSFLFLLNHGGAEASVDLHGTEILTGQTWAGSGTVPAGGVAVLREPR